jgi:hypothetical protein
MRALKSYRAGEATNYGNVSKSLVLEYKVKINTPGFYVLKAHNYHNIQDGDNDFWASMGGGQFGSGENKDRAQDDDGDGSANNRIALSAPKLWLGGHAPILGYAKLADPDAAVAVTQKSVRQPTAIERKRAVRYNIIGQKIDAATGMVSISIDMYLKMRWKYVFSRTDNSFYAAQYLGLTQKKYEDASIFRRQWISIARESPLHPPPHPAHPRGRFPR